MSTFVVSTQHIDVLIWAGLTLKRVRGARLQWWFGNPGDQRELTPSTATDVGRMLLAENTAAYNHSYSDDVPVPDYTYRTPEFTTWSAMEALKAITCYEYQASGSTTWDTSQAKQFCEILRDQLLNSLPDYYSATWAIGRFTLPAAQQRLANVIAVRRPTTA